jgi:ribonuclease D
MLKRSTPSPKIMSEVQALSDEAWNEFTATSPEGIDYIAEASVRGLMVTRIRRALTRGQADRRVLRESALDGL